MALVAACLRTARANGASGNPPSGRGRAADSECALRFRSRRHARDDARRRERRRGRARAKAPPRRLWRRVCEGRSRARRRNGDVRRQKKAKEFRKSNIEVDRASAAARRRRVRAGGRRRRRAKRAWIGARGLFFLNDEEEEDEENETDDARFRAALAFRSDEKAKREKAKRVASASPFGSRDESLLRDALADFVVQSFASSKQSEISANLAEQNEDLSDDPSDDWLGNDLAAKLAAAARRASGDSRESPEMFADSRESPRSLLGETRDGVERFLRRCGDVARARRRYASCGGLVDFAEAVTANDAIENRRLDAHRSLAKELADASRSARTAAGGCAETNLDCSGIRTTRERREHVACRSADS